MIAKALGYQKIRPEVFISEPFKDAYEISKAFTMTSLARMTCLWQASDWLNANGIEGDFIECGVWKGGSSMLMAQNLLLHPNVKRNLHLYDTFEGMTEPTSHDVDFKGQSAEELMRSASGRKKEATIWAYAQLSEVKKNIAMTNFPSEQVHYHVGKVEETISNPPLHDQIALLRLDTDWYSSTKHELECLYDRIVDNGILIIDDYGHWNGCRRAVDEFFESKGLRPFFVPIDYTGVIWQKR
jgi:O-methyltransferase